MSAKWVPVFLSLRVSWVAMLYDGVVASGVFSLFVEVLRCGLRKEFTHVCQTHTVFCCL